MFNLLLHLILESHVINSPENAFNLFAVLVIGRQPEGSLNGLHLGGIFTVAPV